MAKQNNSLGCGRELGMRTNSGFICGVADAWGKEYLCKGCKQKLKWKWMDEERSNLKLQNQLKGGNTK